MEGYSTNKFGKYTGLQRREDAYFHILRLFQGSRNISSRPESKFKG